MSASVQAQPPIRYPRPPAHISPYVDVLGPALALRFLLKFGGAGLYFPNDPKGRSQAEELIGATLLKVLGERFTENRTRIPIGNPWVCAALAAEGKSVAAIARTARLSEPSVRKHLHVARKRLSEGKSA